MTRRLVAATRNPAKLVEIERILAPRFEVVGLGEYPDAPEVAETGATFADNALLKARAVAAHAGCAAVADDSGLCVDALGGMPGVLSARWCGRHGDDEANLQLVLGQLADVPVGRRGASFVCAAAYVEPGGGEHVVEGRVAGSVLFAPRGSGGFGYDPIFVPSGETRTTAEMSAAEKDAISHRGQALRALAAVLLGAATGADLGADSLRARGS